MVTAAMKLKDAYSLGGKLLIVPLVLAIPHHGRNLPYQICFQEESNIQMFVL